MSQFTCMDCGHIFPEAQLVPFKDRFGMQCQGCPKCGCDDFDESLCRTNEFGERIPHMISVAPVSTANLEAQAKKMLARMGEEA